MSVSRRGGGGGGETQANTGKHLWTDLTLLLDIFTEGDYVDTKQVKLYLDVLKLVFSKFILVLSSDKVLLFTYLDEILISDTLHF